MSIESPKEQIEDPDAAREGAYAEKPFRDAEVDHREGLSEEARSALKWIASKEGEEAIAKYEAGKIEEDPVVRILREKSLEAFDLYKPSSVEGYEAISVGRVSGNEWLKRVNWAGKEFGRSLIEKILSNPEMNAIQKQSSLEDAAREFHEGLIASFSSRREGYSHYPRFSGARNYPEGHWAVIIGDLMAGKGINTRAVTSLEQKHGNLAENIDFFERARISFPEIAEELDRGLKIYNFLWDSRQNKYIKLK